MSAELPPGVGTVGEELSKLLAALSARQGAGSPASAVDDPAEETAPSVDDAERSVSTTDEAGSHHAAPGGAASEEPPSGDPDRCTCGCHTGAVPMGQAQVCSLCPLCQGIATLRTLNPELLDRLAHLAALAADTLRELAADAAGARSAPRPQPPRPPRAGRVDIDVVDEPSGDPTSGGEAQG